MLESKLYYNWYRPQILATQESEEPTTTAPLITCTPDPEKLNKHRAFILNKTRKDEVINYVHHVFNSVTHLRENLQELIFVMTNFERTAYRESQPAAMQKVESHLADLEADYNQITRFMRTQPHSELLQTFSTELGKLFVQRKETLAAIGLSLNEEDGCLIFDADTFLGYTWKRACEGVVEGLGFFRDLYDVTTKILGHPLTEHMRFNVFNLHYNYQLGDKEKDGFKMIESGLILDRTF